MEAFGKSNSAGHSVLPLKTKGKPLGTAVEVGSQRKEEVNESISACLHSLHLEPELNSRIVPNRKEQSEHRDVIT